MKCLTTVVAVTSLLVAAWLALGFVLPAPADPARLPVLEGPLGQSADEVGPAHPDSHRLGRQIVGQGGPLPVRGEGDVVPDTTILDLAPDPLPTLTRR